MMRSADPAVVDDGFLEPPGADDIERTMAEEALSLRRGDLVGPYRIEEPIAAGGMGCVHRAVRADGEDRQVVALKVIARGSMTVDGRRRFRRERQVLALLEHPGITRLLDGGATPEGLPYLVMELVEGRPIDRHCRAGAVPLRRRLELFRDVCAAVAHAHRHLVVHRDIKPANVLVTAGGAVKLLDFGVSGLIVDAGVGGVAETAATAGCAPLTIAYASPEQIRGERATTASDVYGLGALLYQLLAGRTPHRLDDRTALDAMRIVCDETPLPPSIAAASDGFDRRWCAAIRGDLDRIVLAALRHEPQRRYASVEQLDEDVRRFLERRPVRARGDDWWYRSRRLVARHRALVAVAMVAAVVAIVAFVATGMALVQARAARSAAERDRADAIVARDAAHSTAAFLEAMLASANPYRHGRNATVIELMADAERRLERGAAPQVEAGVRLAIGRTCAALMMWPEARRQGERVVSLLRTGGDRLALAEALSILGRARTHLGEPSAVADQEEALAIRLAELGRGHALTAESVGNLAFATWASTSDPDEARAEAGYLEALSLFQSIGAGSSRDAARMTMSLGYLYEWQGRCDEALDRYAGALAIYRGMEFTEDLYELATLSQSAGLLEAAGRLPEALVHLEACRRLVPVDLFNDRTSAIHWRIAAVCDRMGLRDVAAIELRGALAHECRRLAARRPDIAARLEATARALVEAGARPGSSAEALDAVDALVSAGAPPSGPMATGLRRLAEIVGEDGDLDSAGAIAAGLGDLLGAANMRPGGV